MAMLALLPWLQLHKPIREGRFHLFPQGVRDAPPADVALAVSAATMGRVLAQYCHSVRFPLVNVALIQYDGQPLGADLDEPDRTAIFQFAQHLAVSGLSDRRFVGGFVDGYTASGHYQAVIQRFTEPYSGSISQTYRRKDGHTDVVLGESDAYFVRPAHLVAQGEPNLNLQLLKALQAATLLPDRIREHVAASVTQFLLANSDSPDVSLEVETIATYAALERVSNSSQRLGDMQAKLLAILSVVDDFSWVAELHRELGLDHTARRLVLSSWLKGIYALRGNVAHGKPARLAPQQWTQQEHLLAGAFVYPLVLKCLLAQHRLYSLTAEDVAWVVGLEKLLGDRPFFEPIEPSRQDGSADELALDTPSRRDAHRSRMTRWQRQFDDINNALLGIELSQTLRNVVGLHGNGA